MPRRLPVVVGGVVVVAAACLLLRPAPVEATQFNPQVAALQRELQAVKQELAASQQQQRTQAEQLREANRQVTALSEELRTEKRGDRGFAGATIRQLRKQLAALQGVKYAHYAVWKRKPFVRPDAENAFVQDIYGVIAKEGSVRGVWVGGTSVPDAGGELAVLMLFDDREGHKAYTEDPATRQFSEKHGRTWQMVRALDVIVR